ncbi:hypothetical protein [Asticcacaulis solisilvae]|uniref:hypothetical protein n=1 Tax=Asticcacaulis solisilvae TaxID=1217274 RepID=UPI003FD7C8F2
MRPWILAGLVLAALPAMAAAQTPGSCTSAESHQFDFWVGKWEVFPAAHPQTKVADSLIEKLYADCAVRENWMPLKGPGGGSLNAFVAEKKAWRQTWLDSSGFADFTGGWNGKAMVIQGVWPQPGHAGQITRMTYTPRPDGSVEQAGETSDDDGKTWQPSFDLIYIHPKP